ncbi:hypothetical protein FNF27_07059 [Cafeteria roenbergensis]|uniref:Uncharacterized protein n=1 Tax=Cafeteria roenbergensis TaxID=33653 RepID=A0A5A8DX11_CAFRO|nr:hypothetical protein FNF29_06792 [Cafeteria roenbergensis]KAA0169107.1 hypothetical protein FNF27_07059 [Cafeteria roenbergensis]|eukprot:KAA0148256.1 hypothetical protein FNF29_06792 [Cafeteria roenbergensis]
MADPADVRGMTREALIELVDELRSGETSRGRELELRLSALQEAFNRKEARIAEMRQQAKAFLAKRLAAAQAETDAVAKERDERAP